MTTTAPPAASAETRESADTDTRLLVEFLREREVACPLCGYNLRGLLAPRCPECGRDLELRVGLSEPRQGAWLLCQLAVSATGGIGLIAIASTLQHGWPDGNNIPWLFNLCFTWFIVSIPLTLAVYLLRRRFLRMEWTVQYLVAAAAAMAALGSVVGITVSG